MGQNEYSQEVAPLPAALSSHFVMLYTHKTIALTAKAEPSEELAKCKEVVKQEFTNIESHFASQFYDWMEKYCLAAMMGFDAAASFGFGDDIEEGDEAPFDSNGLSALSLDAPRMVEQIDINYDKTSKQVDVKKLKEALWVSLQKKNGADDADKLDESTYDFQGVLDTMGDSAVAAGKKDDISVHLCFICLLHLANENTLKIEDCPSMDKLLIQQD